jgi:hypothetical protein
MPHPYRRVQDRRSHEALDLTHTLSAFGQTQDEAVQKVMKAKGVLQGFWLPSALHQRQVAGILIDLRICEPRFVRRN